MTLQAGVILGRFKVTRGVCCCAVVKADILFVVRSQYLIISSFRVSFFGRFKI